MYISSKDEAEWWSQKLKKRHSTDYVIMSKLKRLIILEKVVRNNSDEIEEINVYRTQKIDAVEV